MSKISENNGCKHFPEYSRPNSDQIISKNNYFYSNLVENRGCSIKIAEKIKIVAKAKLRTCSRSRVQKACHRMVREHATQFGPNYM